MSDVKVFAMYLPQYHETEENSRFWGEGFTDWISVKKANSLFDGHVQPQVPLNKFYYDLSCKDAIKWQADLARKYGVDGWGIYHYWFNSEKCMLTKPAEIILKNKDIQMPFFFAWDNVSWKRTWSKLKGNAWSPVEDEIDKKIKTNNPEILIEYQLGVERDWENHFNYLLPYFKDSRYVKKDNKPLFLIYNYSDEILKMIDFWNQLAVKNGLNGVDIIFSYNPFHGIPQDVLKFRYEPLYSGWGRLIDRFLRIINKNKEQKDIALYDYDKVWRNIIKNARRCKDDKMYYGAFVSYDDSPRRGNKGKAIIGFSPEKFANYLGEIINICKKQGKKYIFLTAWNEWGEGAHLEPDNEFQYSYLEAYKCAIERKRYEANYKKES